MENQLIEGYQLSPQQKHLWLLQRELANQPFRTACVLRIEGEINRELLHRALAVLVAEHEILRTRFRCLPGVPIPLQMIEEPGPPAVETHDFRGMPDETCEASVTRLFDEILGRNYDFEKDSPLRTAWVERGGSRCILMLCLPALCADTISLVNLVEQLATVYESLCQGGGGNLQEPLQYADVSAWLNEILTSEDGALGRAHWQEQNPEPLFNPRLPHELKPARPHLFTPVTHPVTLPPETAFGLAKMAEATSISEETVLLACWHILLGRLTEQTELAIAVHGGERKYEDLRDVVGLIAKFPPVSVHLRGDSLFSEWVAAIAESTALCRKWQEDYLTPGGGDDGEITARYPAFGFEFVETPPVMGGAGCRFTITELKTCCERFKMKLSRVPSTKYQVAFQYDSDLYPPALIKTLATQFLTLLANAVAAPNAKVSDLSPLGEAERHRVIESFNQSRRNYPLNSWVHQLVSRQAALTPAAIAVGHGTAALSYGELDRRSRIWARILRDLGAGPDKLVGLYLERSLEMVIGMLATLHSGAAYCPLDPDYPANRLAYMLAHSRAPLILTRADLKGRLPAHDATVLYLDHTPVTSEKAPVPEACFPRGENLAYVLFTSGSTGKPKGVMIAHRAIHNHMLWMQESLPLTGGDKVLQKTPFGFDASVWEFYAPLMVGAQLIMARPGGHQDPAYLLDEMIDSRITILQVVPSLLFLLLEEGLGRCVTLKRVFCGGEVLSVPLQHRFEAQLKVPLINVYGPTEACIHTAFWTCNRTGRLPFVPIGLPVANVKIRILDASLDPVPIGVRGELFVAGLSLGRGYLGRPELTAAAFLPHAHVAGAGARLYKTNDLARFLCDGSVEFLGRTDFQVKLRGFRVELGEIESALLNHPEISRAVVLVREDQPGDQRLVAYLVPKEGLNPAAEAMAESLKSSLPHYMIPTAYVIMESLPLTPHGKVDRGKLPAPGKQGHSPRGYETPRTPTERWLAGLWAQTLGLEKVGIGDNFFVMGGHSLLGTQIIARARATFGIDLSVRALFEAPTIAKLANVIDNARQIDHTPAPPLRAVPRTGTMPLSYAQQRLWFLHQLEGPSPTYNMASALLLTGSIDARALLRSFQEIIRRHESLRTCFEVIQGAPVPRFHQKMPALPLVDFTAKGLGETHGQALSPGESTIRALAVKEAQGPFDLERGPLMRLFLLRQDPDRHILLVAMHHIVSDGWSMGVIMRETAMLYPAFLTGKPSPLPELAIQYVDFAQWQRSWLTGESLQQQIDYWRQQLAGLPPRLQLPTDYPYPEMKKFQGATLSFAVDRRMADRLRELSSREDATLFMTLLAVFKLMLARYSGQSDLAVGVPIANRTRPELEPLVGFFVNTLVLRTDLAKTSGFGELLTRVRTHALSAYAHQDVPFEQLVEILQPVRNLKHTPLFQVMFSLENEARTPLTLPGLEVNALSPESGVAKFDLMLVLTEGRSGLTAALEYCTDLFERESMKTLASHYQMLLAAVTTRTDQSIWEWPMSHDDERYLLASRWCGTHRPELPRTGIAGCFAEQVRRRPDAVAVSYDREFGDATGLARQVTYAALDGQSGHLAQRLREQGVRHEIPVAICLHRSPELVVAMLAACRAGGIYVPLDPGYPRERLAWMLADSGSRVLVSHPDFAAAFPPGNHAMVFVNEAGIDGNPSAFVARVFPRQLAYLIYTSGSTGMPKGVAVPHRAVIRLLFHTRYVSLDPAIRLAQISNASFDAATFEIWGPLLHGGCMVALPKTATLDPNTFATLLRARVVSHLFLTTALFNQVARTAPDAFTDMDSVLFGGEAVDIHQVRRVLDAGPPRRLLHVYGPTENTTFSSWEKVTALGERKNTVPIGRPLSHTQAFIVDSRMNLCPKGIPGELVLGGDGLARHYHQRPDQTAKAFVPNPFGTIPGLRLYRTGDLVRHDLSGSIVFLGRFDHQVKIRGFRIEPGEIEVALSRLPAVKESLVVVHQDDQDQKRLLAYVRTRGRDAESHPRALRDQLSQSLPDYMMPAHIMVLDAYPLTPNGKVDRGALPLPARRGEETGTVDTPRSPTQEILASIWGEVLQLERVALQDNFFELGGHSLLATRVVSRIREALAVELPLRSFFESATLQDLAARVERARASGLPPAPPLVPVHRDQPVPLSHAQRRLWFLDHLQEARTSYNMPIALRFAGPLDIAAVHRAVEEIIRRHEILRTHFEEGETDPVQIIAEDFQAVFSFIDCQCLTGNPNAFDSFRDQLAEREAATPFDLRTGPLLRMTLLRGSHSDHLVLVTMHHIVSDGWSISIFMREFAELYLAFLTGKPSPLDPLPIQYADFAHWQQRWLQGDILDRLLGYWQQQLLGAPELIPLPCDRPRPPMQTFRGDALYFQIGPKETSALRDLGRQRDATSFMTYLAAFYALLFHYSRQSDLCVGSPVANRNRAETETLIGFFVNTLVLRARLAPELSFENLVAQVKETTLDAYTHQDLPYERLVEALNPARNAGHTPIYQVRFVFQNKQQKQMELPGMHLTPHASERTIAKFDLMLTLFEGAETIHGEFEFNTDLFERETIAGMLDAYGAVLRTVLGDPTITIAELDKSLTRAAREKQRQHRGLLKRSRLEKLKGVQRAGRPSYKVDAHG